MARGVTVSGSRGRAGAKRLDLAQMREALRDRRVWAGLAVVRKFPGEAQHYSIETGDEPGVLVDVELMPSRERLLCRMAHFGGVWRIPPEGAEVAVLVPEGDFEADPVLVGILETQPGLLAATNVVIVAPAGGEVLVYDGSGTPKALATKDDVQALTDKFNDHGHGGVSSGASTTSGPAAPTGGPLPYAPNPAGTTVLKAK